MGFGFFCSTSDNRLSTNHRVRLGNLSEERLMATFGRNLRDLFALLELSRGMGLTVFRLGSDFVPFASHPAFRAEWLRAVEAVLRGAAERVRGYCVRITMHPGQFVVLNSPRRDVVERSLAELRYHFWVLDTLGLGRESVVVVHVGGAYGSKREALARLEETVDGNPWLRSRLALENDERHYTAAEVVELAESLGVPAVFDYYHHTLNPSRFSADRLLATWRGVTPEVHLSSAPDGPHRFGEHGDYVRLEDFRGMVSLLGGDRPLDVIVEAKKKELAVSRLLEELRREGVPVRTTPERCDP